jgi:hypothetical protein
MVKALRKFGVRAHLRIRGEEAHLPGDHLCGKQPIERIAVAHGQPAACNRMLEDSVLASKMLTVAAITPY